MLEIERKYLVRNDADFKAMATSSSHIQQGYMAVVGATVRIRLRDDKAYLTIKGKSTADGLSRYEFEREIPIDDANEMMKLCCGGVIDKTRWLVPFSGHTFEVDEFHGENEGLIFAEVELESETEECALPDFIGPEVTSDTHFRNSHILSNPYPNWCENVPEAYR